MLAVHKHQIGSAAAANALVEHTAGAPARLSWDLRIWSKPALEKRQLESGLSFENLVLPHLDTAHNLARWLLRHPDDAQDAVQEAYLRAFQYFDSYRGGDAKAWLLAIVRNACFNSRRREKSRAALVPFDESAYAAADRETPAADPGAARLLRNCIDELPIDFREVLIMRELEEMSYQQIADATGVALGTVMSRLSRARKRLAECAARRMEAVR